VRGEANLVRRGARYYFRCKVPQDLLGWFPRGDIRISLKTPDKAAAALACRELRARWEAAFAQARGRPVIPTPPAASAPTVPPPSLPNGAPKSTLDLLDTWLKERRPAPGTKFAWRVTFRRFGERAAREVRRTDVIAFKDALVGQGLHRRMLIEDEYGRLRRHDV
jgi:hypothetical protein